MNGLRYVPEINGVEYGWANVAAMIGTSPITGIKKISYKDEQEMENIYGAGLQPVARGYGKIKSSASITLLRSDVESIRRSSPTGRLQDIAPFDIVVQYVPVQGQLPVRHTVKNAQFKNDSVEMGEGETSNQTTFELIVSHIQWQ